jgi:polyisoprenoid-binding protein YceI
MKKAVIFITTLLFLYSLPAAAGIFSLDPAHTQVGFSVKHMMITNVKGTFGAFKGGFELDESGALVSTNIDIEAASIDTNIEKRDNHLRSPDFFDVATFPKITFKSISVKKSGVKGFIAIGELTIRKVTQKVSLEGEISGPIKDPWGNIRAGFWAKGRINRKDFGLTWNKILESGGVLVGDKVEILLEGEGILKK